MAKRMLAEKLLQLGLAQPPRHKQEWLLNLESFTDIYRKSEELPNDSLSCRADGLNFHLGKPCMRRNRLQNTVYMLLGVESDYRDALDCFCCHGCACSIITFLGRSWLFSHVTAHCLTRG